MAPLIVLARSPIKIYIYWKIVFFCKIFNHFSTIQYAYTAYSMYTHMGIHVKDFDPSITTVPRFLKSDKN